MVYHFIVILIILLLELIDAMHMASMVSPPSQLAKIRLAEGRTRCVTSANTVAW